MMGLFFALLALVTNAPRNAAEFTTEFRCERSVASFGEQGAFVGCLDHDLTTGETLYAGLVWTGAGVSLETGP